MELKFADASMVHLVVDGEARFEELKTDPNVVITSNGMGIIALAEGTNSGKPAVLLKINLPDGKIVVQAISLKILQAAMAQIEARHGRKQ